jgi:hypothetical protein
MTATLKLFVSRFAHGLEDEDGHVHFHQGPSGAPAVCHDPRCDQPRLSIS